VRGNKKGGRLREESGASSKFWPVGEVMPAVFHSFE